MVDLSIIVPCFNHGRFLFECIESINNQKTKLNFEIIVVDDCSLDDSFDIALKLQEKYHFNLIKTPQNSKLPACRNYGIKHAKGTYIVCLDADDKIPENYFEELHKTIIEEKVDVSYCDSQYFGDKSNRLVWPEYSIEQLKKAPFINCSSLYKKEMWEKIGGYKEDMVFGWEDFCFYINATEHGYTFKKCKTTELMYRCVSGRSMGIDSVTKHKYKILHLIVKNYPDFFRVDKNGNWLITKYYREKNDSI